LIFFSAKKREMRSEEEKALVTRHFQLYFRDVRELTALEGG
jgi:hypothetical protein